jgi:hypothetical protein
MGHCEHKKNKILFIQSKMDEKLSSPQSVEQKKRYSISDKIKSVFGFISQESLPNSEDCVENYEKILVRGSQLHKEKNKWNKRYCTLTETKLTVYQSPKSYENGDDSITSCFIQTSVLQRPEIEGHEFVYSLFSHDKEGLVQYLSESKTFSL